jgi:hypothetical protein
MRFLLFALLLCSGFLGAWQSQQAQRELKAVAVEFLKAAAEGSGIASFGAGTPDGGGVRCCMAWRLVV